MYQIIIVLNTFREEEKNVKKVEPTSITEMEIPCLIMSRLFE